MNTILEKKAFDQEEIDITLPNINGNLSESANSISKYLKSNVPSFIYEDYIRKKFQFPRTHYDPRLYSITELMLALHSGDSFESPDGNVDVTTKKITQHELRSFPDHSKVTLDEDFNSHIVRDAHQQLSSLNYPTYFLDEQTLQMLLRSKLADNIKLEDITFALPSMVISLPKNTIQTQGQNLCSISITKTYEWRHNLSGRYELIPSVNKTLRERKKPWSELKKTAYKETLRDEAKGEICPALSIVGILDGLECVTIKYPIDGKTIAESMTDSKNCFHADNETMRRIVTGQEIDEEKLESESLQVEDVALLGIKILLFMSAKKNEYQEKQNKVKEAKYRRGKLLKEAVWGANFIGKNYGKELTEKGYGKKERQGRKQRYHWRQGHFRGQWYGKNRSKYKSVVIDPYPVGLED